METVKEQTPKEEFMEIQRRIRRAKDYVKDWHTNIKRWRALYSMQHYSGPAQPHEIQYSDPTYTNTVDLAVGIMLGNELRWHSYGFSPSKEEQQTTGKIEKLIAGIMEANVQRDEKHHLYQLFLNFDRDGGGVIYSVFDPEIAKHAEPVKVVDPDSESGEAAKWKFYEMPVRVQVIDPLAFFCLPGGPKRWLMMGTVEKRPVLDVEMEYGIRIDAYRGRDEETRSSTEGIFQNVWDYTWMMKDGQPVPAVRNTIIFDEQNIRGPMIMDGYEDLPFTIQFFKPVGEKSSDWHNIMMPLETSVALLERSFNRRAYQIDVFSGLPLVIKTQPGRKVDIDPGLYNSVNITPDEEITFPQWPGSAPDVQMQLDFLRSRVQQSGFSDVMFGSGQNQVAGYAISQLGDQNRIRLEQPIQHLELLLTLWAKKALKMLLRFAPKSIMCVYGKIRGSDYAEEVETDDLSGYSVKAEIRPNFPNEQTRKTAMSTQVKGSLSSYTIMERYLDIEQPEDEEERMMIEMVTRHPIAIQYAIMKQLKDRADNGDEIAAMTLQQIQQQGMPGKDGRPKEPNNPEQLTGLQGPNGEPPPQAQGGLPPGQSDLERQNAAAEYTPGMTE